MTKGLKSTFGVGSGKSHEQKNGEVAMAIFDNLRSQISIQRSPAMKLAVLCAKKINQKKVEQSLIISQSEQSILDSASSNYGNSDPIFTAQEREYSKELIRGIGIHQKETICRDSKNYKKDYLTSFLTELQNSIAVDAKSAADYSAEEARKMFARSSARTAPLEKLDRTMEGAINTVQNFKALKGLSEFEEQRNFEERVKDLGPCTREISESNLSLEMRLIAGSTRHNEAEKQDLIVKLNQEYAAQEYLKKLQIPDVPTSNPEIRTSGRNFGGGNDKSNGGRNF